MERKTLGADEIQAAGSLWIIMTYCMTLLIGWLRPYLSLFIDPYFLDGCVHTLDLSFYALSYGWPRPCHISCIRDISCICTHRFSDSSVWVKRILIKHFTPPSLSELML